METTSGSPGGGWVPPPSGTDAPSPLRALARRAATPLLDLWRSGDRRTIVWTPPRLGGGNHLYLWLYAWASRQRGEDVRVLQQPGMDAWIAMFPALAPLTVTRQDVPARARRSEVWNQAYDGFGREVLDAFLDDVILSSASFSALLAERVSGDSAACADGSGHLTLNLRRGDFYSDPQFARRYAMDQRAYLSDVLEHLTRQGRAPSRATVISDDPAWCRAEVPAWLPQLEVEVPAREQGMFGDLAQLATAGTLVLTNSTFSYWGGYLQERCHALTTTPGDVWAPQFHVRGIHGGLAWQLSPTWHVIDNAEDELMRSPAFRPPST